MLGFLLVWQTGRNGTQGHERNILSPTTKAGANWKGSLQGMGDDRDAQTIWIILARTSCSAFLIQIRAKLLHHWFWNIRLKLRRRRDISKEQPHVRKNFQQIFGKKINATKGRWDEDTFNAVFEQVMHAPVDRVRRSYDWPGLESDWPNLNKKNNLGQLRISARFQSLTLGGLNLMPEILNNIPFWSRRASGRSSFEIHQWRLKHA